jgi:hypothetical protein
MALLVSFDAVHHTASVGGSDGLSPLSTLATTSTWVACSAAAAQPALRRLFGNYRLVNDFVFTNLKLIGHNRRDHIFPSPFGQMSAWRAST